MDPLLHSARRRGFTLIELLVVIAIIGILSAVILAALNTASNKGIDAGRQEELTQLQTALELYANDHNGQYPDPAQFKWYEDDVGGCPPNALPIGFVDTTDWIPGLVTGGYISELPVDTAMPATCTGYHYLSNGTDYKLGVDTQFQTQPIQPGSPFARCPASCSPVLYPYCYNDYFMAVYTPGAACW